MKIVFEINKIWRIKIKLGKIVHNGENNVRNGVEMSLSIYSTKLEILIYFLKFCPRK